MNERLKKVIIITIFVLVVIGLAYLMYYLFFKPTTPQTAIINTPVNQTGQFPSINSGNVNQIISNINQGLPSIEALPEEAEVSEVANGGYTQVSQVISAAVDSPKVTSSGINYFNSLEGRFYQITSDGQINRLSDERFFAVEEISWSDDGNKAVLEYPDGSNIVYDFSSDKQYSLPKEMQEFDFSDDGQSLAAEIIGPAEENNWLVTSDTDGSNLEFIERLGDQSENVEVNLSPNNQIVALFRQNTGGDSQEILFIGRNQENLPALTTYGRGFSGQWNSDGSKILYSVYQADNNFKPSLWVADAAGDSIGLNNTSLGLETWQDKCVISQSGDTAYCGVPQSLPAGSGLYRDLAEGIFDDFYKVDLNTGQITLLAQPVGDEVGYSAENISLSSDESTLYFQDASTGYLYSINLP